MQADWGSSLQVRSKRMKGSPWLQIWLSFNMIIEERSMRWVSTPPTSIAYFSTNLKPEQGKTIVKIQKILKMEEKKTKRTWSGLPRASHNPMPSFGLLQFLKSPSPDDRWEKEVRELEIPPPRKRVRQGTL